MIAKKALCPNEFLDDYSHKGYIVDEDEHFYYVIDALLFEWSRTLEHQYLCDIQPQEYTKPYYKPIMNEFRDITAEDNWIFEFPIKGLKELFLATYFFDNFLYEHKQRKNSPYDAYTIALNKAANNLINQKNNPNYKTIYQYNNDTFDSFSHLIYDFLINQFGISFVFESKKPL